MNRFFRWHQKRYFFSRLCFVVVLTFGLGTTWLVGHTQQSSGTPLRGGGVHGSVFTRGMAGRIALPDFEVFLQNVLTREASEPVKTNLVGRFAFPTQKAGSYELRWRQQAGWQEGVLDKKIVITEGTAYPGFIEIKPQEGLGLLVGQVKRADGSSPWVYDEFFGINQTAQVVVLDGSGKNVAGPVRANVAGEFAFAGLPKIPLEVRATSEAAFAAQSVPVNALSFGGPVLPVILTFSQRLPEILSVSTTLDKTPVHNVAPGATVTVTVDARSSSSNGLKFDWKLQEGMGTLHPAGATADWTLPAEPGPYTAYVMISDGFGGYVTRAVSVLVGVPDAGSPTGPAAVSTADASTLSPLTKAVAEATTANPTSATTCLKVILDDVSLNGDVPLNSNVPLTPGLSGSTIQVKTLAGTIVTSASISGHVVTLSGLPADTDLTLEVLNNSNVIFERAPLSPLPSNVVHTAAGGQPDCQAVKLVEYPAPGSFLELWVAGDPGSETAANSYYTAVDAPTTLGGWWTANGFDSNGNDVNAVRVAYLNNNDLGSGRDMHFLKHNGIVSAYVTNYVDPPGKFNQNPAYADSALAHDPSRRAATVCMEWSPVDKIVKFFVYAGNGGGANAVRQPGVDLDGNGVKYVPQLCLNCHGPGSVSLAGGSPAADQNASFREFDLATIKYPGGRDVPNDTERSAFKQLNLIVRGGDQDTTLSTPAIKQLIDGWYQGPASTFTGQYTGWNPPGNDANGWDDHKNLYHAVVAKSCRTCHVAFDPGINWTNYDQFAGAFSYVFSSSVQMPHSQITYKNFWSSRNPSETGVLRSAGLGPAPTPTP